MTFESYLEVRGSGHYDKIYSKIGLEFSKLNIIQNYAYIYGTPYPQEIDTKISIREYCYYLAG